MRREPPNSRRLERIYLDQLRDLGLLRDVRAQTCGCQEVKRVLEEGTANLEEPSSEEDADEF